MRAGGDNPLFHGGFEKKKKGKKKGGIKKMREKNKYDIRIQKDIHISQEYHTILEFHTREKGKVSIIYNTKTVY